LVQKNEADDSARVERMFGNFTDAISLSLLIAPHAWMHHYVLAIPVILFAVVKRAKEHPLLVVMGAFCILVSIPDSAEVLPIMFRGLAGLILLSLATTPKTKIRQAATVLNGGEESANAGLRSAGE
jgi:hypothetical protein